MRIISFDGEPYNTPEAPILIGIDRSARQALEIDTSYRDRTNQSGVREAASFGVMELDCVVTRNPKYLGLPLTPAEFRDMAFMQFAPYAGPRRLTLYLDAAAPSDETVVFADCDVISFGYWEDGTAEDDYCTVVFRSADPVWLGNQEQASTGPGIDAPIGGNWYALPVLTITDGDPCGREVWQVADPTGRGLLGHPVKILTSGSWDTHVFERGRSLPFLSGGGGIWLRMDLPASTAARPRAVQLDIYKATGIANPLYGDVNLGGINPASTNSQWQISGWNASQYPRADGAPQLVKQGRTFQGVSYGVADESASGITFAIQGGDVYDRVFDAVAIPTGRGIASVTGLDATLAGAVDARGYVKILGPNAIRWADYSGVSADGAIPLGVVPGVVAVMFGIEPLRSVEATEIDEAGETKGLGYARAAGTLAITGTLTINLAEAIVPVLLSSGDGQAINNVWVHNTTTGDKILIRRAFYTGGIVIDALNKSISATTGRAYVDVRPRDPDTWFRLKPKVINTIDEGGLTIAYAYRHRWVML